MKERIKKIRDRLDEFSNQCFLAWHSPFYKKDPFVNLESSFLTVVAKNRFGEYVACRFTGTLEQNEIKHQRILFEGEALVRIRNGPRSNLVVKPSNLRYEETAVVAGLIKELSYGKQPVQFYHTRDGDIDFLEQLETVMFTNDMVPVQTAPFPEPYKKVRSPEQVQPRITGELVTRLKEVAKCSPEDSVTENFYKHYKHFCVRKGSSLLFPMSQVNGKGLTVLDLSSVADESYLLPIDNLDMKSEIVRLDLMKSIDKDKSAWSS